MLRRNLLIYGLGGLVAPFVGIKLIDLLISRPGGVVNVRRQLPAAIGMVFVFTVLTGLVYPLVVTAIGQAAFHDKAEGSLVEGDGEVVGSRWIGQQFTEPEYFHPRPSAAGDGYDGGGELGLEPGADQPRLPRRGRGTRRRLSRGERARRRRRRSPSTPSPPRRSGLDPHISVANARLQAPRVAAAAASTSTTCSTSIDEHTDGRDLGFLGEPGVNVLSSTSPSTPLAD